MSDQITRILEQVKEGDIKFIKLQFVDLFGELKNISITSTQLPKAMDGLFMVDGFHIPGMHRLGLEKLYLKPDLSTFAVLPWRPQQGKVARMLCDLTDRDGHEIPQSPRHILRMTLERARLEGLSFDIKPDCEFFLFVRDENGHVTTHTGEAAGYLDVAPLDKGENARRELILSLEDMGFEIESSHHELASGQHSVRFKQRGGIRLADQIVSFRTTIRTVAERHGMHATFMPKPRTDLPGSSMRLSISVFWDGKNLFSEEKGAACAFLAGILKHQSAITAFSNPIVNSYKRLKAASQAPSALYWSSHDHFAPLRLSENESGSPCIEWTLPDGSANPYLVLAAVIAAGCAGMRQGMTPPPEDVSTPLPSTLLEALHALSGDDFLREVFGESFVEVYIHEKQLEWERYSREVTDWELKEYLRRI